MFDSRFQGRIHTKKVSSLRFSYKDRKDSKARELWKCYRHILVA